MIKPYLLGKALFLMIGMIIALILCIRPVPSIKNSNDTGRYIQELHQLWLNTNGELFLEKGVNSLSYNIFYTILTPAQWIHSESFFLFLVAAICPLGFLLFSKWRNGTLLLACSWLFSFYGLEAMTNIMRQSLGMFLLFGAITLIKVNPVLGVVLGLLAACAHFSALIYLPLLLWFVKDALSKKTIKTLALITLVALIFIGVFFHYKLIFIYRNLMVYNHFYDIIYSKNLKISFLTYTILPLYYLYCIRFHFEKWSITRYEKEAIVFSTFILLFLYLFFPYITYRIALFATPLQLFLISRASNLKKTTAGFAFLGMVAHLLFLFFATDHIDVLIYG